ncbi:MAG TPA: efflux RND transporter permease subunit [Candidatus Faecivicinus avistercoris]|nr:efflux RND transporter permease subunit [Candidatus Faecivicinus avistercoris]
MLGKYSVKKPYTVVVGVILVIVLGVISFTNMTTDLLPNMDFPYVIVYTTYVGATPEQVEDEVTRPMEAAFATLTDINEITSTSSDNLSLVVLEFNDTADMNTALIEINSEISTLSATWSDSIGAPAIMKINPNMLPVSILSVSRGDMDILELSEYVEETLVPEFEAVNGVASVTASGLITQEVDVTIEQDRIDVLNNAILRDIDAKLADVEQQLDDAQAQISDGRSQLARMRESTLAQLDDALAQVESGEAQMDGAIATLTEQRAELQTQLDEVSAAVEQLEALTNLTDEQRELLLQLEAQLANLRAQRDELEERLDAIEAGEADSALQAQRDEAQAQRDALADERARYEAYIADLTEGDSGALAAEIAALDGQIAEMDVEIANAQQELAAKTDARDATQAHVNELRDQIAQITGATPSPSAGATGTVPPTNTPNPVTPSPSAGATDTASPTDTPNPSATGTANPADTPNPSATGTASPTNAASPSAGATEAAEPAHTVGATGEASPTAGLSATSTASFAAVPTIGTASPDVPSSDVDALPPAARMDSLNLFGSAKAEGKTLEELQAELAVAEEQLEELNASVAEAEEKVEQLEADRSELVTQRNDKQEALDAIAGGDVTSRIEAAQREIDALNVRIAMLDAEIASLDDLLSDNSVQIQLLREAIAQFDAAIAEIENSDAYKALQLIADEDELNAQYIAAVQGQAQLQAGIDQIDGVLEKLNQGIVPGGLVPGIDEDTDLASAREQIESGRSQALAGFAEAEAQLDAAAAELAEGRAEFEEQRDQALEDAGIDGIITMETVATILGAQNISMPAGYVYDLSNDEYLVRVGDEFTSLDELRQLKLFSMGLDSVDEVRLIDVASVEITDNSDESFTKVDGQDGILLSIEKQSTFSTTDVAERVLARRDELMAEDAELQLVELFDQGEYINVIIDSVIDNLISGAALAILVLLVFLMDWRPTIIIAFSIPLSVVVAFVCMYFTGITLNVLSLSGLALGIGMLVDNSIVSIDNIYRLHDEEGLPILQSCVRGVSSIAGALTSSTLTTISVFLPVVFVTGLAHDLFTDIGLTITYSLVASLVVAMTLVPSMAAALLRRRNPKKQVKNHFAGFQRFYVRTLRGALRFKPLVLLLAVALLAVTVLQVPNMSMSFMPEVNSTQMTASLAYNADQDEEEMQAQALELMNRMMQIDGISTVGLTAGTSAVSMMSGGGGDMSYYIIVDSDAGRSNVEIGQDITTEAEAMGLDLSLQTSTMDISMLTGTGVSVDIVGDDVETLRAIASDVSEIVRGVEGTTAIDDGLEASVPEIRITVDKERATDYNLTVGQVLQFVATKLAGKTEITEAALDGKSMSVYIIDGRNSSITPDTLADLEIEAETTAGSELVRLGDIAQIEQTQSLSSITRSSQRRQVSVTFDAAEGYALSHVSDAVEAALDAYQPPEGYEVALSGENETVNEIMGDMVFMMAVALVLIFLIMVAQFQSFKSPFIVLFTIPLAFTGGLIALLLTGMDLSIVAMVGFLVLMGVVVNNGIVFVDSVNQMRIAGMTKRKALLETGRVRLRPILMTAITTILGMLTLALGVGMGSEMMQPMAVVTIGGLTYATFMTLFIVPVLYDLFNGEKMSAREIQMAREAAGLNDPDQLDEPDGPDGGSTPPDGPDGEPTPPNDPDGGSTPPDGPDGEPTPPGGSGGGSTPPDGASGTGGESAGPAQAATKTDEPAAPVREGRHAAKRGRRTAGKAEGEASPYGAEAGNDAEARQGKVKANEVGAPRGEVKAATAPNNAKADSAEAPRDAVKASEVKANNGEALRGEAKANKAKTDSAEARRGEVNAATAPNKAMADSAEAPRSEARADAAKVGSAEAVRGGTRVDGAEARRSEVKAATAQNEAKADGIEAPHPAMSSAAAREAANIPPYPQQPAYGYVPMGYPYPQGYWPLGAMPYYPIPQGMVPPQGYAAPQGTVSPQGMVPPQGYVTPQGMVPPQGYVTPQGTVPPQGYAAPQGAVPPQGYAVPQGTVLPQGYAAPQGTVLPQGAVPQQGYVTPQGAIPAGYGYPIQQPGNAAPQQGVPGADGARTAPSNGEPVQ